MGPVLFSIFINNIDSGIECTLGKCADDMSSGAIDMLEGRDAIQRIHDRFKEWVHMNLKKFSQARQGSAPLANTTITTDRVTKWTENHSA